MTIISQYIYVYVDDRIDISDKTKLAFDRQWFCKLFIKSIPTRINFFFDWFFFSFFQASLDDDDDDSPIIRGFADDEPLVVS